MRRTLKTPSRLALIEMYRSKSEIASVGNRETEAPSLQLFENRLAYSISEVASGLGVSTRTVERAIQSGSLPTRKIGRRRIILYTDLGAWLNHKEQSCAR